MIEIKKLDGTVLLSVADLRDANLRDADLRDADLRGANLRDANLRDANLCDAHLRSAYLRGANLRGANLCDADLRGAVLCGTNLRGAVLCGTNLCGADLRGADLCGADLRRADLRGAVLCGADLHGADLRGADLCGADLRRARGLPDNPYSDVTFSRTRIIPEEGEVVGWKKCRKDVIVKLLIPRGVNRSHAMGRKCRAERAIVLEVIGADEATSQHDDSVRYRRRETVQCHEWCDDWKNECAGGIHFFTTRIEAENY